MHEKNIKRLAVKQLKKRFPQWSKLTKKQKKALANEVLKEVMKEYSFDKEVDVPLNELTGTPEIPEGIMTLSEMERFVTENMRNIFHLPNLSRKKYIKDNELTAIDELLDNRIIDKLLAPDNWTPSMRILFPSHLFRAELLKSLKYPEISYRKYCDTQINTLEQKMNRAFICLPLHKKVKIDHSQLSQFRSSLTFRQMVNIMVYIIHLFLKTGKINNPLSIYSIDSSELPAVCSPRPLAAIEIGDKKVRIYGDLEADCGKRRKKRDKSEYFVGYRIHSLVVINPSNGQSYPLISLLAPGNHHDSLFLEQLIQLGKAIGLDMKIIIADEAYGDGEDNKAMRKDHDITVITPPKEKVKLPDDVDGETKAVYMNSNCETPMSYAGRSDTGNHEFICTDEKGECMFSLTCDKCREIPVDAGIFGQIPEQVRGVEELRDLRKNMERAFNLLKHREGLEPVRVKSMHGLMAVATFATAANLLIEIVGSRKTQIKENSQQQLKLAA